MDVAALKACTGIVALCWATTSTAASGGTASSATGPGVGKTGTTPSLIRLLYSQPGLAGTCGGSTFDVSTYITVTAQASADVKVSAQGVGTIEEFTDETGKNIGPYNDYYPNFQILAFGGGLPPNTLISIAITTYAGPNLSGPITYFSQLVFNCTSGAIVLAQPGPAPSAPVPAVSPMGLAATAALLLLLGAIVLRRRRARAGIASKSADRDPLQRTEHGRQLGRASDIPRSGRQERLFR